jgi:4-amino-4-deoxy-L-arabinose transferase-like glycosyltransferase
LGYLLAVVLLLVGAGLRALQFSTLPIGFNEDEITDVLLTEAVRQGNIEVFYDLGRYGLGSGGREGLYHTVQAALTGILGNGLFGYRISSFWVGMLTLTVLYALAQRLFGPLVGVASLALMTTNMWSILLSRQVGRETVLPLMILLVWLALARVLAVYREHHSMLPETTGFALLGALLGLGFYVHPTHIMVVLFSALFILYRLRSRQRFSRQALSYLLFALLLMIIIATPYLISSIRLSWLSGPTRIFDQYDVVDAPLLATVADSLSGFLFVGDASAARNVPGRPLIDLVSGLLLLIGVLTGLRNWRQGRYALVLIAAISLMPAALVSMNTPNFTALTPLIPVVALFFGIGVRELYRSLAPRVQPFMGVALVGLIGFNLVWTSRDLYTVWPESKAVYNAYHGRLGDLARHIDRTAADLPTVVCESGQKLHPEDALTSTDLLDLMMNRKDLHLRFADCGTSLIFVDGGGAQQIIMPDPDTLAMMQSYLRQWVDRGQLVAELPPASVVRLEVAQPLADTIGRFTTTAPAAFAPDAPGGTGLAVPPVRFGGNITFLGYEAQHSGAYPPGGDVVSITYWRVDGEVPPDLRFFTHILADPASCCVTQNDTIGVDLRQLRNRDVFVQLTFLQLPYSTSPGEYSVSVGAYTASNDARMVVIDGETERGNRLFLERIRVE